MSRRTGHMYLWGRFPAVRLALFFASGILLADRIFFPPIVWSLLFFFLAAASALSGRSTIADSARVQTGRVLLYALLILLFGSVRTAFEQREMRAYHDTRIKIELLADDTVSVRGTVRQIVTDSPGFTGLEIDVSGTLIDSLLWKQPYRARLYGDSSLWGESRPEEGELVEAVVTVQQMRGPDNPHQFDIRRVLFERKIVLQGDILSAGRLEGGEERVSWHRVRSAVQRRVEQLYSDKTGRVAKALMLGYREGLSSDEENWFQRAGLSHIMAVSGMHVGFLMAPFWVLLPWVRVTRPGRAGGLMVLITILTLYAGITRFTPSVCRASLMIGCLFVARLFNRSSDTGNLLGLSALVILVVDPDQLYDVGFQLSYSAVGIIVLVYPYIRATLHKRDMPALLKKAASLFLLSATIQLGLMPLLLAYFNAFSLAGPVANMLALPLLAIIVPTAFLSLLLIAIRPDLVVWIGPVNTLPVELLLTVARLFGTGETGWIEGRIDPGWMIPLWFMLILFIGSLNIVAIRWKCLIAALLVATGFLAGHYATLQGRASLRLVLLDVGQGDAIYIRTPGGRNLLVDTGRWSPWGNSGESVLVPYLKWLNVKKLDALILTHPHADHIGGVLPLLESFPVDTIYSNGAEYDSGLFRNYRREAARRQIPERAVSAGDMIELDPSIRILVLGPLTDRLPDVGAGHTTMPSQTVTGRNDPNNSSVILKIVYNRRSFLLAGDAGVEQEEQLISRFGEMLKSDFLKVGHHGSRTSSAPMFLNLVSPSIAAGSASGTSEFGHPHTETIHRLRRVSSDLFFTSRDDALVFESDGLEIFNIDWKQPVAP